MHKLCSCATHSSRWNDNNLWLFGSMKGEKAGGTVKKNLNVKPFLLFFLEKKKQAVFLAPCSHPNHCWRTEGNLLNYSACCAASGRPPLIFSSTCSLLTIWGKQRWRGWGESQEARGKATSERIRKDTPANHCLYASNWQQLLNRSDN